MPLPKYNERDQFSRGEFSSNEVREESTNRRSSLNKTKAKKKTFKIFFTKVHPVSIYFQLLRNGESLESDFFKNKFLSSVDNYKRPRVKFDSFYSFVKCNSSQSF